MVYPIIIPGLGVNKSNRPKSVSFKLNSSDSADQAMDSVAAKLFGDPKAIFDWGDRKVWYTNSKGKDKGEKVDITWKTFSNFFMVSLNIFDNDGDTLQLETAIADELYSRAKDEQT